MYLETERLILKDFSMDMAHDVHVNSLDEATEQFVPDEVFKTEEDAKESISFLMSEYGNLESPQVYPVFLKKGDINLGYVQLVPLENGGFEIGYHIAENYRKKGYATEATKAFLEYVATNWKIEEIYGICRLDNRASLNVLSKCGFVAESKHVTKKNGKTIEILKTLWKYNDVKEIDKTKYTKCEWK